MSKESYDIYDRLNAFFWSFELPDNPVLSELREQIVGWLLSDDKNRNPDNWNEQHSEIIKKYISKTEFDRIKEFAENIPINSKEDNDTYWDVVESYKYSISMKEGEEETPWSLNDLMASLLKINVNDNVADLCAGTGGFVERYVSGPDSNVGYSFESDYEYWASNVMSDRNYEIPYCINVFDLADREDIPQFSKIFSNYPFNQKYSLGSHEYEIAQKIASDLGMPELWNGISSDWLFNLLILRLLKKEGRAVALMSYGSCINKQDAKIRKAFVEKGYIDAVITLPERIFSTTNIKTAIVVFSYGNTSVRLVDASNMCGTERRNRVLDEDTYDQIYNAFNQGGEYESTVTFAQLEANDYSFYQGRYLDTTSDIDMIAIDEICKRITRGVGLKAEELDELYSKNPTENRFLMMNDISHGEFSVDKLRSLNKIDERYRKYCVQNGNLILAKNSYPFKVALAEIDDSMIVLANSNLYIIEVDKEKMNPYFLKMYLESEEGQTKLKSVSGGSVAASIGVANIKKMQVPCPSLKWQDRMVSRYKEKLKEIHELEVQLEENRLSLANIIEEQLLYR